MFSLSKHLPAAPHADFFRSCFINYDDDYVMMMIFMVHASWPVCPCRKFQSNHQVATSCLRLIFLKKVVN